MTGTQAPGKTARNALLLALTALLSPAAFASTSICDEIAATNPDDATDALSAEPAAHENVLTPRVEAFIREAFSAPGEAEESDSAATELRAALPGVADDDSRIYLREMYRTDI
jgi:hypothetical protein